MNTPETKQVIMRFYTALDTLKAMGKIRGINTYCTAYNIDRRNLYAQRKDLERSWFQVSWLCPMVKDFGVSARWLLTGYGGMFETSGFREQINIRKQGKRE